MRWIAREHQFDFPRPMVVMGIVVIMMAVVIVVSVWVLLSEATNEDVVVRVAVIRDKGAASVVTGKLHLRCINLVNGCNNALAMHLHNSFVVGDGSSSELGVSSRCNMGVTSGLIQLDAVRALRSMIVIVVLALVVCVSVMFPVAIVC